MKEKEKVIMQVLPALLMGGVEQGTIEIAKALKKQGIKNIVVSSGGKMVAQLKRIGVKHIQLPVNSKNPLKMWMNSFRLAKIIKEEKVTLVHVRSRAPAFSVKWACQRTSTPFITSFHGVYNFQNRFKKWYNKIMLKGKLVIAVSQYVQNHIEKEYNFPKEKIRLIHRGADVQKFCLETMRVEKMTELAHKYQISLDKPIITLVGRLTKWKGQLLLIEALNLMKHQEVSCLFVGSAQGRDKYVFEMRQAIETLPKKTKVHIISDSPDMPSVYFLSDIVVSASIEPEAFGRVIPEAQSMGRLVLAARHGGPMETIQDLKTGFLFNPSDPKDLAQKLDEILDIPLWKQKEIQTNSVASVRKNFSTEAMCQKTLNVYAEVLNQHEK